MHLISQMELFTSISQFFLVSADGHLTQLYSQRFMVQSHHPIRAPRQERALSEGYTLPGERGITLLIVLLSETWFKYWTMWRGSNNSREVSICNWIDMNDVIVKVSLVAIGRSSKKTKKVVVFISSYYQKYFYNSCLLQTKHVWASIGWQWLNDMSCQHIVLS